MLKIAIGRRGLAVALSAVVFALASPSYAKNMVEKDISPFDIIKSHSAETRVKNYTKLSKSLGANEAMALDAKFSELYGEATISRNGTKVWEIPNPNARKGQAKHITITCGPDADGFYISVDARGAGTGNYQEKQRLAKKQQAKVQKSTFAKSNRATSKLQAPGKSRRLQPNLHD